jgi:hypothetical protein
VTITTTHNSVADAWLGLWIPDDNNIVGTTYADSTYIKQRYTAETLIAMESGLIDKNDDFVFFNDFNIYRGNEA